MNIDENLLKDIQEYCLLNQIDNIDKEIEKYIKIGFTITKYGSSPFQKISSQKNSDKLDSIKLENNKKNIRIIQSK